MDVDAIEKNWNKMQNQNKLFQKIWSDGIVFGPGAAQQIKKLCFQKILRWLH